jgi:hypothetical protein
MLVEFIKSLGSMPLWLYAAAALMELLLAVVYYMTRAEASMAAISGSMKRPVEALIQPIETVQPPKATQPDSVEQLDLMPDSRGSTVTRERRRSNRYAIDMAVHGKIISAAERKPIHGRVADLSLAGMLLILPFELKIGDTLQITFTLPYCSPLEFEAVIRNRRGLSYGVEFINVTATQQRSLSESIEHWRSTPTSIGSESS